ncbi:MAG: carbohydrate-binding family 9-like protein [Armatimonadota bacterium]
MAEEKPVYQCRKVPPGSITVDGNLNDPGWQSANVINELMLSDGSNRAERRTSVRMCWDDRYLYISFDCDDPDIWGTMHKRDDPIFDEEVVEAFIDPDSDLIDYYEFEMSPRGVLFDAIIHNPTGLRADMTMNKEWDCEGWLTAVRVDGTLDNRDDVDKGWTAEWAIPFASILGADDLHPGNGDTWRINLFRIDLTPTPEFSCWSPTLETPANFHVPKMFGTLVFAE